MFSSLYLSCLQYYLFAASLLLRAFIPPYRLVEMISKSFIIQAFIALIILASSLTFSVNAAAIAPARQFLFQTRTRRALLTSDLEFSREDYERAALSAASTTDNENRFGEFLFSHPR